MLPVLLLLMTAAADSAPVWKFASDTVQECSPDRGPSGRAAAGMYWQYGRDVAGQLEATREAVADALGQLRTPMPPGASVAPVQHVSVSTRTQQFCLIFVDIKGERPVKNAGFTRTEHPLDAVTCTLEYIY